VVVVRDAFVQRPEPGFGGTEIALAQCRFGVVEQPPIRRLATAWRLRRCGQAARHLLHRGLDGCGRRLDDGASHARRVQVAQEGVDRAVHLRLREDTEDGFRQGSLETPGFGAAYVFAQMLVAADQDMRHVECRLEQFLGHRDGGVRSQRIKDAQLEGRIDVVGRQVGNHQVGAQKLLVHRLVAGA